LKIFREKNRVVKVKKNEIQKRMKENQEKNNFTVKKFEESIENVHFIKKNSSFFFILFVKAQENRAS